MSQVKGNNMGYTTDLFGAFKLDKPLKPEQVAYLLAFSGSRRIKRNAKLVKKFEDPLRVAVGLPIGDEGEYFVAGGSNPERSRDIINYNDPPAGQPGLWCQWTPNQENPDHHYGSHDYDAPEGTEIGWDGGEKFYYYVEWLKYIIEHFLKPWGYVLNGEVKWQGERRDDIGLIIVKDNVVTEKIGRVVYKTEEEWSAEDDKVARDNETVQLTEKGKKVAAKLKKKAPKKKTKTAKKAPKKYFDSRNVKKAAKKAASKKRKAGVRDAHSDTHLRVFWEQHHG
jgi:hypothetical protein